MTKHLFEYLAHDHDRLDRLLQQSTAKSGVIDRRPLHGHNALEEQEGGLYLLLNHLAQEEEDVLLERMKSMPEVPVMPYNEKPDVLETTRRALMRAGYQLLDIPE